MTTNQSAMERLKYARFFANDQEHRCMPIIRDAIDAVLAEHDAAQALPPSEAKKLTSEQWHMISHLPAARIAEAVVRRVSEMPDRSSPEDWPEALLVTQDELTDIIIDQVEMLVEQAPKVPPSERAREWGDKVEVLLHSIASNHPLTILSLRTLADEAVRLMSRAEPVAEAPKRLRAGWREDMNEFVALFQQSPNWTPHNRDSFKWLLDEAEASAAPEPAIVKGTLLDDAMESLTDCEEKRDDYRAECDRLNGIIDALTRALLAAQGRQP